MEIQQEFRPLVIEAVRECREYFGDRFLAVYLHGSVDKGDAVVGISDLDMFVIVSSWNDTADRTWLQKTTDVLSLQFDVIDETHLSVVTEKGLAQDRFARFALRYNATLLAGEDIAQMLDADDKEHYLPDKHIAQMRLSFARRCLREALEGKEPACTGALPKDHLYAARKFARYFIIIEGAYFLMARGVFQSFDKETVISQLRCEAKGYEEIINLAQSVLTDPLSARVTGEQLIRKISPLTMWMFDQIEKA